MINVGVIGCGQWGPNHIRIFSQLPDSSTLICADLDQKRLDAIAALYPKIEVTTDYKDILSHPDVNAVSICAPTDTHFQISKEALEAGKHVLCEKPLCLTPEECENLGKLAEEKNLILMVGHVFVFNPGIVQLKEYIQSGEIGKIHYAYSIRTNLGPFRYDVNALWDLAPHDISIFNHLFDSSPVNVSARGQKSLGTSLEDLAFANIEYPDNVMVNVHVSWLDPKKVRQITIVGEKKMVVWDDLNPEGPVKLYDKHVEKTNVFYNTYGEFKLLSSEGSITVPKIKQGEPLKAQGEYFINCILKNTPAELASASKAASVVKVLCSIQESIHQKGACVDIP